MLTIWKFVDGKRGHESQSSGLIEAIGKNQDIQVHEIQTATLPRLPFQILGWFIRKKPNTYPSSRPDLIIGAGRQTHVPMLIAKSFCGGKTVVLMRPSLPTSFYDLVVVPQHDEVVLRDNIVEIKGVLNVIKHSADKDEHNGLMLIGGQSTHYKWNNQQVVEQIKQIVRNDATVQWTITTSRRTPESFIPLIQDLCISENLDVVPFEETDQQWMLDQFRFASQIWVTPDSVSMVYEALSSGAIVRIFLLDPKESKKVSRVVHGLQELVQESTVGTFEKWKEDPDCVTKPELFNEAERVAQIVVEQLL